jgi:bacteriocin biosynthesis cyclodehydratase domain-containing protein
VSSRPRLRSDTFLLPLSDGAYIRAGGAAYRLPGRGTYALLQRLSPFLDGRHSIDELVAGLPSEQAALLNRIVAVLEQNGLVADAAFDLPHSLSESEQSTYAAEIAVLAGLGDSPEHRFERFRRSRALVVGSGLTAGAVTLALMRLGLMRCAIAPASETAVDLPRLHELLSLYRQRDPALKLDVLPAPTASGLAGFDIVVHASDRLDVEQTRRLTRAYAEARVMAADLHVAGDHALIGPIRPPGQRGCWECAWLRLRGGDRETIVADAAASPFLAPPTAGAVAGELAFAVFKAAVGAGAELEGRMVDVDLETLRRQENTFLPHPDCQACGTLQAPAGGRLEDLTDERFGIIETGAENGTPQVPLRVAVAKTPTGSVTTFGSDTEATRREAILAAGARYAASLLGSRRLGRDLATGDEVALPAAADVFVSYGSDREQAMGEALLAIARRSTLDWLAETRPSCPPVDLSRSQLDQPCRDLLEILDTMDCQVRVLDCTGPLGIPTLVAEAAGFRTCRCHPDPHAALAQVLQRVVGWRQLQDVPGRDLDEGELLEVASSAEGKPLAGRPRDGGWPEWRAQLQSSLAREVRLLEVALDSDTALTERIPHLIGVVRQRAVGVST